jgi:hypothetical protein
MPTALPVVGHGSAPRSLPEAESVSRRTRTLRETDESGDRAFARESLIDMDQDVADNLFDRTAERFRVVYAGEKNPTVANHLSMALELMIDALGHRHDLADPGSNDLWSLGSAGYAWRVAEGGGTGHAKRQISEAVAADFEPSHDRPYALVHAASGVLKRRISIGLESPGGFLDGPAFLQRGLRYAIEWIANPDSQVEPEYQEAAFYFGVALHDVKPYVDELRGESG